MFHSSLALRWKSLRGEGGRVKSRGEGKGKREGEEVEGREDEESKGEGNE